MMGTYSTETRREKNKHTKKYFAPIRLYLQEYFQHVEVNWWLNEYWGRFFGNFVCVVEVS